MRSVYYFLRFSFALSTTIDLTVQPPLNPSKIKNGSWSKYWLSDGETSRGSFYDSAPSEDINGEYLEYYSSHGTWKDSNGGYSDLSIISSDFLSHYLQLLI